MQLKQQDLDFLDRLGRSPDGLLLRQLLKGLVEESNEHLRTRAGDHLLREQGRAVLLDDLAKWFEPRAKQALTARDLSRHLPIQQGPRD